MIRKLIPLMLILVFVLAACAPATPAPLGGNEAPIVTPSPEEPVSSDDTAYPGPGAEQNYLPQPNDEMLVRQDVQISTAEILTLESFPPQFRLHLAGEKGNPCDLLRVVAGEPNELNEIDVEVYILVDPAGTCIQMVEMFDTSVSLGEDLPAGSYTVFVNGKEVGSLTVPEAG